MGISAELGAGYCNLPDILQQFENELVEAANIIDTKGKLLERSLSKNSAWMHYYDSRRNKLTYLTKFFKMEENRVRGELYCKYKENYSRSLSGTDILKYIEADPLWIEKHQFLLEVEELEGEYISVVDALKALNYSLGHITKLYVSNLEFSEI